MELNVKRIGVLICMAFVVSIKAQKKNIQYSIRAPIQVDFQKAEITYGPDHIEENTTVNFGLGFGARFPLSNKLISTIGIGYFREQFTIKRPYDHQALNPGDSLFILTKTRKYRYNLLTFPIGFRFVLSEKKKAIDIGLEYIPGFVFSSNYIGGIPFKGANTIKKGFDFFSHSANICVEIPFLVKGQPRFSLQPFVRIIHTYKMDKILFDDPNQTITRYFDSFGISFNYLFSFNIKFSRNKT